VTTLVYTASGTDDVEGRREDEGLREPDLTNILPCIRSIMSLV
jgi:hypothetical protein